MKILDTLNLGSVGGTDSLVFSGFPDEHVCAGLRLRCSVPVTNGSGGTISALTTADVKDITAHIFGALSLSYGDGNRYVAYGAVPGVELRNVYRAIEEDEVPAVIVGGSIANAASGTVIVDLLLPFRVSRFRGTQRMPGTTQMRTMRLDVVEGASATITAARWTRAAGNLAIDVIPVTRFGPDYWAPILSLARVNQARLTATGPDGLTLIAWEQSATLAATTLLRAWIFIGGRAVHENIQPAVIADEYVRDLDQGGANIADEVTVIYAGAKLDELEALPAGPLEIRQNGQELATIQLRALYYPDLPEAGAEAARLGARRRGEPVLASAMVPSEQYGSAPSPTMPVRLYGPSETEFTMRAGLLSDAQGSGVNLSIPQHVQAQATAVTAGAADPYSKIQAATKAQKIAALQVPGATATTGHGRGASLGRQGIRQVFSPLFQR
jgi:hypothetical protein